LPVYLAAPKGARLAIDVAGEVAYLDGVELTHLADLAFAFLVLVARAAGALVPTKVIAQGLGSNRIDLEAPKKACARLRAAIAASFEAIGRKPPADLATLIVAGARGGYRVSVEVFVR
jgi:hypothetical protein